MGWPKCKDCGANLSAAGCVLCLPPSSDDVNAIARLSAVREDIAAMWVLFDRGDVRRKKLHEMVKALDEGLAAVERLRSRAGAR